jgi:hypothetical protein
VSQVLVPPTVHIELPLEGAPRVFVYAATEGEQIRMLEAIEANDRLAAIVLEALELAEEQRAA